MRINLSLKSMMIFAGMLIMFTVAFATNPAEADASGQSRPLQGILCYPDSTQVNWFSDSEFAAIPTAQNQLNTWVKLQTEEKKTFITDADGKIVIRSVAPYNAWSNDDPPRLAINDADSSQHIINSVGESSSYPNGSRNDDPYAYGSFAGDGYYNQDAQEFEFLGSFIDYWWRAKRDDGKVKIVEVTPPEGYVSTNAETLISITNTESGIHHDEATEDPNDKGNTLIKIVNKLKENEEPEEPASEDPSPSDDPTETPDNKNYVGSENKTSDRNLVANDSENTVEDSTTAPNDSNLAPVESDTAPDDEQVADDDAKGNSNGDTRTGDRSILPFVIFFAFSGILLTLILAKKRRLNKHAGKLTMLVLGLIIAGSGLSVYVDYCFGEQAVIEYEKNSITIQKVDENGKPLAGAEFEIYVRPVERPITP